MAERTIERELHVEPPRCPFCHEALRNEDSKTGCGGCMAWHHAECWLENLGRCASCGRTATNDATPASAPRSLLAEPRARPSSEKLRRAKLDAANERFRSGGVVLGCLGALACGVMGAVVCQLLIGGEIGAFAGMVLGTVVGAALAFTSADPRLTP